MIYGPQFYSEGNDDNQVHLKEPALKKPPHCRFPAPANSVQYWINLFVVLHR